jgi:hypothetical protein
MIATLKKIYSERILLADSLRKASEEIQTLRLELATLQKSADEMCSLIEFNKNLEGANFPIYMNNGVPSFNNIEVPDLPRVVIISIPKSGTYLVAEFLKKIGLYDTGIHLHDFGFTDYREKTIEEMVSNYRDFAKLFPLNKSINLLRPGNFAVGHISHNEENENLFKNVNKIFMIREIRVTMVSMMRWLSRPGRGEDVQWKKINDNREKCLTFLKEDGRNLIDYFKSVAGWLHNKDVLTIRFEDLVNEVDYFSNYAHQISKKAGIDNTLKESNEIFYSLLGQQTKTWSGKTTNIEEYWSNEAEEIFKSIGGQELNYFLGYFE